MNTNNIYTVVCFKPSAHGYDYTDGFISSDYEVTVEMFNTVKDAADWMAEMNADIYNDGTLNRKPYDYINAPEYEFKILVNGCSTWSESYWAYDDGDYYDQVLDIEIEFAEKYKEKYDELVNFYKAAKENSVKIEQLREANRKTALRHAEYLKLKEEFE